MAKSTHVEFTKAMKKDYTLLIPSMCKIHFQLLQQIFIHYGYHVELLTNEGRELVD